MKNVNCADIIARLLDENERLREELKKAYEEIDALKRDKER